MAYLASTYAFGTDGRANFSGRLYMVAPGFDLLRRVHYAPHCSAIERHPSVFDYGGRKYLLGGHTRNILIDEDLRCLRMGMIPPPKAPEVSAGAGAVPMIGYLRLYDELTGERSPLTDGTEMTGDVPRAWINLPTTAAYEEIKIEGTVEIAAGVVTGVKTRFGELRPGDRIADTTVLTRWSQVRSISSDTAMVIDDTAMAIAAGGTIVVKPVYRASHIEGWVSVNGTLPRKAWQARLGTTSITESVASLALGEALVDNYEAMPTGGFGVLYNDRTVMAGVPGAYDTVFLSEPGFPERHAGLRFRTDYGEPVVGLFCHSNYVVVLAVTPDGETSYRLAGYTDLDYELKVLESKSGGLGHHGNREIPGGIVLVPGAHGMQLFNGAFHPGIPTRQSEWVGDCRANIAAFEGGFSAVNKNDSTYRFVPYVHRVQISSDEPAVGAASLNAVYSPVSGVDSCDIYRENVGSITEAGVGLTVDLRFSGIVQTSGISPRGLVGGEKTVQQLLPQNPPVASVVASLAALPANSNVTGILEVSETEFYLGIACLTSDSSHVYRWDGSSAPVLEDTPTSPQTGTSTVKVFQYGNDVIAIYTNMPSGVGFFSITASERIRRRDGTSGVWSDVSLPAGYTYAAGTNPYGVPDTAVEGDRKFFPHCGAVFNGELYIGGLSVLLGAPQAPWGYLGEFHNNAVIMKYNGSSLTLVHSIAISDLGFVDNPAEIISVNALFVYNNKLYFGLCGHRPFVGYVARLPRIGVTTDGVSFTNVVKDLGLQFGQPWDGISKLFQYDGRLCAVIAYTGSGNSYTLAFSHSPSTNIPGDWNPGLSRVSQITAGGTLTPAGYEGAVMVMP